MNEATVGLARSWAGRDDVAIYHVTGERNLAVVRAATTGLGPKDSAENGLDYRLVAYEKKMPALLAACDLAVCRAGASTVAELAAIGTPSVLVPLPGAPNDHQTRNAEVLSRAGGAVILLDDDCTEEGLRGLVESLMTEPGRLCAMSAAAAAAGHRDAAEKVAELVESVARGAA